MRVIESRPYRSLLAHSSEFIAQALELSLDVVERCVNKLDAVGIIAQRWGKFEPVQALTVDTRAIGKLREHWAGVAAERARVPRSNDIFSYNVLSASRADMERIDALLRAAFREIRMIVANTSEDEVAALVNLQLVRWGPRE